jgi:hypothetical protein
LVFFLHPVGSAFGFQRPPTPQPIATKSSHLFDGGQRRYSTRRAGLSSAKALASRRATGVFQEAMRRSPQLGAEQEGLLQDFLGRSDLGKFAPVTPAPEDCQATAGLARSLIEQTTAVSHLEEDAADKD